MANMVIFCRKTAEPFTFRQPSDADFLGSHARREFLLPRFEVSIDQFANRGEVIKSQAISGLQKSQRENARTHWYFMRDLIPAKVWESW